MDRAAVVRCLGISRLVIAAALLVCGLGQWWQAATVLFVVGVITDAYDGSLARHWGVASRSGARLDHGSAVVLVAAAAVAACFGKSGLTWFGVLVLSGLGYTVWYLRRRKLTHKRQGSPAELVLVGVLGYLVQVLVYATLFATHGFDLKGRDVSYALSIFLALFFVIGVSKGAYIFERWNNMVDGRD